MKMVSLYVLLGALLLTPVHGYYTCEADHYKVVGQCKPCDLICPYQGVGWAGCKHHCPDMYNVRNGGDKSSQSPLGTTLPTKGRDRPTLYHTRPSYDGDQRQDGPMNHQHSPGFSNGDHHPPDPPYRDSSNRHHPLPPEKGELLSKKALSIIAAILITLAVAVVILTMMYWRCEPFRQQVNTWLDCHRTEREQSHNECDTTLLTQEPTQLCDLPSNNDICVMLPNNPLDDTEYSSQVSVVAPLVEVHGSPLVEVHGSQIGGTPNMYNGPRRRHEAGDKYARYKNKVHVQPCSDDVTFRRPVLQRQSSDPSQTGYSTITQSEGFGPRVFTRQISCPVTCQPNNCVNTGVVGMETGRYNTSKCVTEKGSLPRLSTIVGSDIV